MSKSCSMANSLSTQLYIGGRYIWALCFALLLAIAPYTAIAQIRETETPEQHINRLVKEAAGIQPIRNAALSSEREFDAAFRLQYRGLIESNRDYKAALKQVDSSIISQLGTPQSLTAPASADRGLTQLHLGYKLEVEHEQKVEGIYVNLKHILETAAWATPRRAQLLKLFEMMTVMPALERQHCIAAEKVWIDSLDELYRYANQHTADLQLVGSTITIDDPEVQQEFNRKIVSEGARRITFLDARQNYAQKQAQAFRSVALDPKNVGLQ